MYYITANQEKIRVAQSFLTPYNISFESKTVEIIEIQSDSIEEIAISKAEQAYAAVKEPLFVNDSGWSISALHGFPGPFLRYMNNWFDENDYLRLLKNHTNREVILKEVICYIDKQGIKTFDGVISGEVVIEPRGEGTPWEKIVTLSDSKMTMAECKAANVKPFEKNPMWGKLATFLRNKNSFD